MNNIDLFFDDEPIESVIYKKGDSKPSPVNIFPPLREKMYEIRNLFENKSISVFSKKVTELLDGDHPISRKIYLEINDFLGDLTPNFPKPILKYKYCIHDFCLIVEKLWDYATINDLQIRIGNNAYRWYEHYHFYAKARDVLQELITAEIKSKNKSGEAVYVNNFAFEYLLEKKWKMAAPLFEKAANIFFEEEDTFEYYNARANYLICQFENNNIADIEATKEEVELIKEKLTGNSDWRTRKPYILLAKLEEKKGNFRKAISAVEKAISYSKGSQTTYPEEDHKYLNKLVCKQK